MRTATVAVLLLIAVGAVGQELPPVTPLTQPMIYDSTGKVMGQLVSVDDFNAAGTMLFSLPGGDIVTLHLKRFSTGVRWGNAIAVYYSLPGCLGDAFIAQTQSFSELAAVVDKEENLLVADTVTAGVRFNFLSSLQPDGNCSPQPGQINPAVQLTITSAMRGQFSPPFRVANMHRIRIVSTDRYSEAYKEWLCQTTGMACPPPPECGDYLLPKSEE